MTLSRDIAAIRAQVLHELQLSMTLVAHGMAAARRADYDEAHRAAAVACRIVEKTMRSITLLDFLKDDA